MKFATPPSLIRNTGSGAPGDFSAALINESGGKAGSGNLHPRVEINTNPRVVDHWR
jgi:hypothetical protein